MGCPDTGSIAGGSIATVGSLILLITLSNSVRAISDSGSGAASRGGGGGGTGTVVGEVIRVIVSTGSDLNICSSIVLLTSSLEVPIFLPVSNQN